MAGSYTVELFCTNCHEVAEYDFEKGVRVTSAECDNCGVKALKVNNYRNNSNYVAPRNRSDDEEDL